MCGDIELAVSNQSHLVETPNKEDRRAYWKFHYKQVARRWYSNNDKLQTATKFQVDMSHTMLQHLGLVLLQESLEQRSQRNLNTSKKKCA